MVVVYLNSLSFYFIPASAHAGKLCTNWLS